MKAHTLALVVAVSAALVVAAAPRAAQAKVWTIDSSHSTVGFKVRHMMVSWVRGSFDKVEGTITYDPAKPAATQAHVRIDVSSIDTGSDKRDAHLQEGDFFDVANHPAITFESKAVKNVTKTGLDLVGDLTLRGVTREVTLKVTDLAGPMKSPWGSTSVGASATAVISREEFGLKWNKVLDAGGLLIGKDVHLALDVEAKAK